MKLLLLVLALGFYTNSARAECVEAEPLCHAMHTLSGAMGCLTGKLPIKCDTDANEAIAMKAAAKDARKALEAREAKDPKVVAAVDATFDKLDAAIDQLAQAIAKGDAPAKQAALDLINQIKKQGHMDFDNT